ncbi:MAG TPA: TolC family protein [Verrucomicrobiota bacterium]|nr:TolC family protein [Verrucomicrobiota bacterium]
MKQFRVLLVIIASAISAHAQGDAPKTRVITLQECIQQALRYNLNLQIERYNPDISMLNVKSAQAGYDPVFSFSGQHSYSESGGSGFDPVTGLPRLGSDDRRNGFESSLGGLLPWGMTYDLFGTMAQNYGTTLGTNDYRNTRGEVGIRMTQPLLKNFWIDSTRLNIQVSKNRMKYTVSGLQFSVMDVVTSVENAYYDLIAARENVKVRQKAMELAERLLAENKKRVEVGALAPLDEKQAESQVATARADLLSAQQTLASQQNIIKALLTDNYRELHDVEYVAGENLAAPVFFFDLQESWTKGMTQRPDLQQAKLDLERQGIQLKYDYNQLFPQLDAYGTYGYGAGGVTTIQYSDAFSDFSDRNYPFYSVGGVLSFPLSNRGARNNYKATKISVQQAVLAVKRLEQIILAEIDNAVVAAKASYQRVAATRSAREYAEAALDAEQKKLESGKSTSFVVLQLQRDLTDARSQEIAALADYNKALAALAFREGSTLDRQKIDVNVQ